MYNTNDNNNSVVNNSNGIDRKNKNTNISDDEGNNIVTNNVVNRSIGGNRINISDFLNSVIYGTGYIISFLMEEMHSLLI